MQLSLGALAPLFPDFCLIAFAFLFFPVFPACASAEGEGKGKNSAQVEFDSVPVQLAVSLVRIEC